MFVFTLPNFLLVSISVCFFHLLFYIPSFLAFSKSLAGSLYMVILIPPALAVFVIFGRWSLCFWGEESAVSCCPSYFMPHCDRHPVFLAIHTPGLMPPTQSQPGPYQVKIRVNNTVILHFGTSLAHECLMRMSNHA